MKPKQRGGASRPQRCQPEARPRAQIQYRKEPDDWVSGDEPMTGAQASSLKTCPRNALSRTAFSRTSARPKRQNESMRLKRSARRCNIGNEE
jgi:hypothetical protein